jgi:hypothetical protein
MLPPEKRIRAEGTREDRRLVDQETIDAVNERLAREIALASERQARMTRADSHYLQPLMVCGHCGGSMVGARNRTTHYSSYCSDRYEYRTIKGKPPCVLNKILVADVETHLAEFPASKLGSIRKNGPDRPFFGAIGSLGRSKLASSGRNWLRPVEIGFDRRLGVWDCVSMPR